LHCQIVLEVFGLPTGCGFSGPIQIGLGWVRMCLVMRSTTSFSRQVLRLPSVMGAQLCSGILHGFMACS
jgi:hypothetical protein